jgi:hypothetical protein
VSVLSCAHTNTTSGNSCAPASRYMQNLPQVQSPGSRSQGAHARRLIAFQQVKLIAAQVPPGSRKGKPRAHRSESSHGAGGLMWKSIRLTLADTSRTLRPCHSGDWTFRPCSCMIIRYCGCYHLALIRSTSRRCTLRHPTSPHQPHRLSPHAKPACVSYYHVQTIHDV